MKNLIYRCILHYSDQVGVIELSIVFVCGVFGVLNVRSSLSKVVDWESTGSVEGKYLIWA